MRAQIPRTWVLSSDWSPESEGVSSADITNSPNTNRIRAAPRPEKLLLPTWCSQREPGNTTHVVGYGPQQGPGKNTKLYLDKPCPLSGRVECSEPRPTAITAATMQVFFFLARVEW